MNNDWDDYETDDYNVDMHREPKWSPYSVAMAVILIMVCLFLLAYLAKAAFAAEAVGHPLCAEPNEQMAMLLKEYHEEPVFTGSSQVAHFEMIITANPDGSSWTVLTTNPMGQLCAKAAGDRYVVTMPGKSL